MQEKLGKYEYLQGQVDLLVPKTTVMVTLYDNFSGNHFNSKSFFTIYLYNFITPFYI